MGRGAKPDWLVILRNQNQTLLSIQCQQLSLSVSLFILCLYNNCFSFLLRNVRSYCTFYIYLAKPLRKLHKGNKKSNTNNDPQDILLH